MSSKSPERHSIKVNNKVFQSLNLLKDIQEFQTVNEVIEYALNKAFPNLDDAIAVWESTEKERLEVIKQLMGEKHES